MFSFRFTIPEDDAIADLSLSQCEQRLEQGLTSQAPDHARLALVRRQAQHLMDADQYTSALAVLEEAIALNPDDSLSLIHI